VDVQAQIAYIIDTFEGAAFSNDPADHGNATKYGVTRTLLSAFLGLRAGELCAIDRVEQLSRDEAIHVGTEMMALRPGLYRIRDARVRFVVLDMAFHSGPAAAVRALQQGLGIHVDGVFGPATESAANAADGERLSRQVVAARLSLIGKIVQRDTSQVKWLAGWLNRIGAVLCYDAVLAGAH
jgi:lysozyme family protein